MEFYRRQSKTSIVGESVGYCTALTIFLSIAYYITGRAGLHGIEPGTYATIIAALFFTGAAFMTFKSLRKLG
ncbi:MAG: hypothetical protein ABIH11_02945 [Candidatus Altiarchaeota archaeon]